MLNVNMKLIVGLGNPGEQYKKTRHNVGFLAIEKIAKNENFSPWKINKKFNAEISKGAILTEKIILAKPQIFMNNSGASVKAISDYYKILANDIIVIHDDLDLPLAKIRINQNASSGGHKGVQNIIDCLTTQNFARFRLGIANEHKENIPADEYVLKNFTNEEYQQIDSAITLLIEAMEFSLGSSIPEAMNEFN